MQEMFQRDGIRFQYPSDWQLETETEGDGWTASLQSTGTAFLVVSYVAGIDDPSELVAAAIEGLTAEYPKLDTEEVMDTLGGQPAVGADVNFVHLDLTNTCWVRAAPAGDGSLLVMAQCCDEEIDEFGPFLKAIVGTVSVDE
jgi:hypothetical protein